MRSAAALSANAALTWTIETAAVGDGEWYVAVRPSGVCVIAAPGTLIMAEERRREVADGVRGWRVAAWNRTTSGTLPVIDRKAPDCLRDIDTREALTMLGGQWREHVWQLLVKQLEEARIFGAASPGHPAPEDLARAGALSAAWLAAELTAAFPERVDRLVALIAADRLTSTPRPVPDYPEQFFSEADAASGFEQMPARPLGRVEDWMRDRLRDRPNMHRAAHVMYQPIKKADERLVARRQASTSGVDELNALR